MELAQKYLSSMLMLKDKEGDKLIDVELNPTNWDTTKVWITVRNKRMATANRLSSKFPLQWTHACLSVEIRLGRVTLRWSSSRQHESQGFEEGEFQPVNLGCR